MNIEPTVVFRADGNAQIGLGHIMRCLALADMLAPVFTCRFAIHAPASFLLDLFSQRQLPITPLYTVDVDEFTTILEPTDIVVLDGYLFDEPVQRAVKASCRKLVYIDDLLTGHQVADLLINHTAGILPSDYDAAPYTRFALGPKYALVNPLFSYSDPRPTGKLLVNLGGADPMNLSYQIVASLLSEPAGRFIRVVLGGANPHRASFDSLPTDRVAVITNLSIAAMADEISACELTIISCSTIAYEVATVGRPFIGILSADNQQRLARFLAEQQLAVGVLPIPLDLDRLAILVRQASIGQDVAQQRLYLDGLSAHRFIAAFRSLATQE